MALEEMSAEDADSNWEVRHDETSGQQFYVNVLTGESSWDPPPKLDIGPQTSSTDLTHQQWSESYDDSGNVYYVNLETMETRWTPPSSREGAVVGVPHDSAAPIHRPHRPSTAEQMAELNRLLSGGDDDDDQGDDSGDLGEATGDSAKRTESCAWMMFVNESDDQPYYYNHLTGECVWEPPEEFVRFHNQSPIESIATLEAAQNDIDATLLSSDANENLTEPAGTALTEVLEISDEKNLTTPEFTLSDQIEITPEFEDKVRRAIEAVSKTPIGSSRLLFVRTPTEHRLPASTRESGEQATTQSSGRLKTPTSVRPESATNRQTVDEVPPDILSLPTVEIAENNTYSELSSVLVDSLNSLKSEEINDLQISGRDMQLDPEIATSETKIVLDCDVNDRGTNDLVDNQPNLSIAAVVLQCAVRCFVARRRVQAIRKANAIRDDRVQQTEANIESDVMLEPEEKIHAVQPEDIEGEHELHITDMVSKDIGNASDVQSPLHDDPVKSNESLPESTVEEHLNIVTATTVIDQDTSNLQETPINSQTQIAFEIVPMNGTSTAQAASPTPKSSRRSPSRSSTASQLPIARKKDSIVLKTSPSYPAALDVAQKFPCRPARLTQKPERSNASTNAFPTRPLAPWLRDPSSLSVVRTVCKTQGNETMTPAHQQTAEKPISPDTLAHYLQIYNDARHKFESEQIELEHDQENIPHAKLDMSNQPVKSSPGHIVSDEEIWTSLNNQFVDSNLDQVSTLAKSSNRRVQEFGARIMHVESSIRHVEQQLEAAELCIVADEDEVASEKRLLQAKYASKLRRRLRSLISAAEYWHHKLENLNASPFGANDELQVEEMVSHRSWDGDSTLHFAAWNGWSDQVRKLISSGADVNRVDNSVNRSTPLHEACCGGNEEVVRFLLEAGASETIVNEAKDSALHIACRSGWPKIVCLLLLWSMDAKSRTPSFVMVLHAASTASLHRVSAFFNARNGKHRRAIDLAGLPSLVDFLRGAWMDYCSCKSMTNDRVRLWVYVSVRWRDAAQDRSLETRTCEDGLEAVPKEE